MKKGSVMNGDAMGAADYGDLTISELRIRRMLCQAILRKLGMDWKDDPRASTAQQQYEEELGEIEAALGEKLEGQQIPSPQQEETLPGPLDQVIGLKSIRLDGRIGTGGDDG